MDDLISRRAALDATEESRSCNPHKVKEIARNHEYEHKHFIALLRSLPPEPRWIPCSNTVDIPDYEVLCCDKRGNELIGWLFYSNGKWICESEGEIMYDTIAWMKLPEPWKGESDG